ncbi:type VI secretion system protein [Massilia sp. CF038]|uniref:type VI secretion system protein n=1 Tax=Massilia sp. CF038 TaxID=1881045 RepID=UPI000912EFCC|nr:type VI secretion system protein [Massilia sp. CF038]SHH10232.1 ImcF-related N-terminal domain-containing protein [Massilia sp. CF038]
MSTIAILLGAALVLSLLLLWLLLRAARRRAQRGTEGAPGGASETGAPAALTRHAASAAFSGLGALLPETAQRYDVPLVLLAGDNASGKSHLLATCGLERATAQHSPGGGALTWHAFDRGVVLEVGADYLDLAQRPGAPARAWDALAEAIQRYRPRRPLDAIVIAVGADVLSGPRDALERLAEHLQRRVAHLQWQFGLRLPLYVLVTKADLVPGFAALADSLPPALRCGMLGWSNPQGGATFHARWVDDAFDAIGSTVAELSCEILAAGTPSPAHGGLLGLGAALADLRAPASAFIAQVMATPDSQRSPLLRGVYLCGSDGERVVFTRDLLVSKLFAETGIAAPLPGQVWARDRQVRQWRLATVILLAVWVPALAWSNYRLARLVPDMDKALVGIQKNVDIVARMHQEGKSVRPAFYSAAAEHSMASISRFSDTLLLLAVPASWHWTDDNLDEQIEQRFADALRRILLPAIGKKLSAQVAKLTGAPINEVTLRLKKGACDRPAEVVGDPAIQPNDVVEQLPAFLDLASYVGEMEQITHHLDALAQFQQRGKGEPEQLADMARFTGAFTVPDSGLNTYYLKQALHKVEQVKGLPSVEGYQVAFNCGLDARHSRLLSTVFEEHPLSARVALVQAQLRASSPEDGFGSLQTDLANVKQWLAGSGSAWLHPAKLQLSAPYIALMGRIDALGILGDQRTDALKKKAREAHDAVGLVLTGAAGTGSAVLQRSADGAHLEMTPALAHMEQSLSSLMQQRFMQKAAVPAERPDQAGLPLWDVNALAGLRVLAADWHAYQAQSLGAFPPDFQLGLRKFANARLKALLITEIERAQSATNDLPQAYLRLGQAQPDLVALLEELKRLDGDAERELLAARLGEQANLALAGIDEAFKNGAVYLPEGRDFSRWDGRRHPFAQLFGGGDSATLDDYLQAQLAVVEKHAALARPLVLLLTESGAHADVRLAQQWNAIDKELQQFAQKIPGSHAAKLHSFIRTELAEWDQQNCQAHMPSHAAGPGNDFFSGRLRELSQRIGMRCRELVRSSGASAYGELARAFRTDLANRFPFAPVGERQGTAATAEAVASFVQNWDRLGVAARQRTERAEADDSAALIGARRFLASGDKVVAFLTPLVAPEPGAEAGYDVRVRFRVSELGQSNANNALPGEIGGNRIGAWTLQIGDRTVRSGNGEPGEAPTLRWRIGMKIRLTLRWADNAPALPLADPGDPHMRVAGREVQYEFDETWSLLRLLGSYRVNGAQDDTLQLRIPLTGAPASGAARVFLRLALSPANKKTLLAYPAFPLDAPAFENTVLADGARRARPPLLQTGLAK